MYRVYFLLQRVSGPGAESKDDDVKLSESEIQNAQLPAESHAATSTLQTAALVNVSHVINSTNYC